jgi:hypothetical protein
MAKCLFFLHWRQRCVVLSSLRLTLDHIFFISEDVEPKTWWQGRSPKRRPKAGKSSKIHRVFVACFVSLFTLIVAGFMAIPVAQVKRDEQPAGGVFLLSSSLFGAILVVAGFEAKPERMAYTPDLTK